MKIRGLSLITLFATGVLLLSGCGNHNSNSSSSPQTKTSVSKSSKSSSDKDSKALWNDSKDAQLKKFIDDWAPTMHQSYQKFDGEHTIKTSTGMVYPDDLTKVSVDGSNSSIGWSKSGKGHYAYNVVAIYNYNGSPNHITYFFAFHDGQPVALVDQSSGGTPDLTPTKNNDVQSSFANIAGGESASSNSSGNVSSSNSNSTTKSKSSDSSLLTDPRSVGVMAYVEVFPTFDLKYANTLHYGPNEYGQYGEYEIAAGASGATIMEYTIDGNVVHCWRLDPDSADVQADETMKEETISLKSLKDKYYPSNSQRQEIIDKGNSMIQ
ncbi:DUF4767 domain-containing protein [Companilactobacillus sp.]|uniref:Lreu_0056 family protein n=1 Tax=Companilactobacillus sp. TaxID=2767905 RepID=UPI0034544F08